jgi:NAD(P)-dependent dehydrogenase (short-subunit alcohol dehydrogenase family)
MNRRHARRRAAAALAVGIALGAVTSAGTALLLYTGQGFLRAAGLLIASTVMALAAGLWAGTPEDAHTPVATRGRWLGLALAFIAGAIFALFWSTRAPLREMAAGGAVAVLLVLALPAYAAGVLLAGMNARDRARAAAAGSGVAAAAAAGAAFGILLSTTVLIQALEPFGIYYGGAALVALASLFDRARAPRPLRAGDPDMNDRVVLITGAGHTGQLGYTVARRFIDAGATVIVTARSGSADIAAGLSGATGVDADLSSDDDVSRLVEHVQTRAGRLDVLVNVAGGLSVTGSVEAVEPAEWTREFERNTVTALRLTRAALPLLRASNGAVINFAAPAGERAVPQLGAYSAAKAGVVALTRALAIEEKAHGVRVNAIAPGLMDTGQNRADAAAGTTFVELADVADVVLFLASPAARAVTGETIHVLGATIR